MAAGKGKQSNRQHDDGDGRHDDSKGKQGNGKRQQGDRRHDDDRQHDNDNVQWAARRRQEAAGHQAGKM